MDKDKKTLLIFGCGPIGRKAYKSLREEYEVEAFLDNSPTLQGTTFEDVPIVSPDKYAKTNILVLIAASTSSKSMIRNLLELEINNFESYTDFVEHGGWGLSESERAELARYGRQIKREIYLAKNNITEDLTLHQFTIFMTERCTLRCKDCATLMPYFENPQDVDYETTIKAFDRLYNLCDWIYEVHLVGGDSMLNKQLPNYIKFLQDYERISDIVIYTNGIIVPDEQLLNQLTDNRISVRISEYRLDAQKNLPTIIETFGNIGIPVYLKPYTEWFDVAAQIYRRNRTPEELTAVAKDCIGSFCTTLNNNKLWRCAVAPSFAALDTAPLEVHEYVDMFSNGDDVSLKKQIIELMKLPYLKVCDYCIGMPRHGHSLPPAIQATKKLELSDIVKVI